ncbi:MAG: hypothetical protein GY847_39815 [Proteobacteria bacterium]|nr:hypothetical protein [Pseudomonadota bacterium]
MRPHLFLILGLLAFTAGFSFSAVSAYDSISHVDRQVHGIHCSYFLGMGQMDASGGSGCYTTLMSPYSSVLRKLVWGGIPVALPSMSVFSFLFFWGMWLIIMKRQNDSRATGFLFTATAVPLLSSLGMGYLSFVTLDTACKLCVGIYGASALGFIAAGGLWIAARKHASSNLSESREQPGTEAPNLSWGVLFLAFSLGVLFVAVPFVTYAAIAPDYSHYVGNCGSLVHPEDPQGILVPIGPKDRNTEIIEVLDPLCAACGIFERRFESMPESDKVSRKVLLFPLDSACNWMIDETIHPGACTASEAVLCAGDRAKQVLNWVIDEQNTILEAARRDPDAAARIVTQRFPAMKGCIGSPIARARLNFALRWAVKNQLQVLTPQIYVQGLRLCDEDTDLGLDYALPRLIARARSAQSTPGLIPTKKETKPRPKPSITRKKRNAVTESVSNTKGEVTKKPVETGDRGNETSANPKNRLDSLVEQAKARITELEKREATAADQNLPLEKQRDTSEKKEPDETAPREVP